MLVIYFISSSIIVIMINWTELNSMFSEKRFLFVAMLLYGSYNITANVKLDTFNLLIMEMWVFVFVCLFSITHLYNLLWVFFLLLNCKKWYQVVALCYAMMLICFMLAH